MTYTFAENIQRGILYLLKNEENFYLEVNLLIKPEYFEFEIHSNIVSVIKDYFEKYQALPNSDFIIETIKANPKIKNVGDYIDELEEIEGLADTDYTANKDYYIDLTEKYAKDRAFKEAIIKSLELIQDEGGDYSIAEKLVREALLVGRQINVGQSYFDDIEYRYDRVFNTETKYRYPTPFEIMNNHLDGGNCSKELALVVALPGTGKSLFLVNQAYAALMQNKKVLYISLEMSEDKISARFDSVISRLSCKYLKTAESKDELNKRLAAFKKVYPESQLVIKEFPTGMANVNTIRALLHNLRDREKFIPDLIIVDYLELLRPLRNIDAEYLAQQRIAEELRGLGVEYDVLIWSATQPNREGAKVEIITDAQLGDSYGKIRVADFSISINQTRQEYDEGKARVYVMKARDAKQKYIFPIKIDYTTLVMKDLPIIEVDETLDDELERKVNALRYGET